MRILIYDNNTKDVNYLYQKLKGLPLDSQVDTSSTYNNAIDYYDTDKYNIIFIDFIDETGKEVLEYIIRDNPKQRIITISKVLECSEKLGCDFCLNNYNKKRILKPIHIDEIIKIFSNKETDCTTYLNNSLLMKLQQLDKLVQESYSNYTLDQENLTFVNNGSSSMCNGFFFILDKLAEYNVKHEVEGNNNIKGLS